MSGMLSRVLARFKRRRSSETANVDFTPEWDAVTARARGDMEARRRALEPLALVVAGISAVLLEADPVSLGDSSEPGEYDSEAETIVLRLSDQRHLVTEEEVLAIVHEEFVRWFGADLAGPQDAYATVAGEVHRLWGDYLAEE